MDNLELTEEYLETLRKMLIEGLKEDQDLAIEIIQVQSQRPFTQALIHVLSQSEMLASKEHYVAKYNGAVISLMGQTIFRSEHGVKEFLYKQLKSYLGKPGEGAHTYKFNKHSKPFNRALLLLKARYPDSQALTDYLIDSGIIQISKLD